MWQLEIPRSRDSLAQMHYTMLIWYASTSAMHVCVSPETTFKQRQIASPDLKML